MYVYIVYTYKYTALAHRTGCLPPASAMIIFIFGAKRTCSTDARQRSPTAQARGHAGAEVAPRASKAARCVRTCVCVRVYIYIYVFAVAF